jgi:hypothetical protein
MHACCAPLPVFHISITPLWSHAARCEK